AVLALMEDGGFCVLFGPSWSPDSSRIALGCSGGDSQEPGLLIFDPDTGELLEVFENLGGAARTDWLSDGSRIASASSNPPGHIDNLISVWDAATGDVLQTFAGHNAYSYGLSWSPDGSRIATGDLDGMVKVWKPDTGEEVLSFRVPGSIVNTHWHPDGTHIIVTGEFSPPAIRRVWPSTQALIDHAYDCCVTRELTPEERQQFSLSPREE
ncbi:WD40 repeat domain-containing protein, partial [Chloroflexota bacterium]